MDIVSRFRDEGFLVSPKIINDFSGDVSSFIDFVKVNQPGVSIIDERVLAAFNVFNSGAFASNVRVLASYEQVNESRDISHWLSYYNRRYDVLSSSLSKRAEMKPVISVNRVEKLIGLDEFGLVGLF
ncbi:MAG TPA: hypothetical protein VI790_02725, partial [Candidatus Nanoarchaeia archaeon]|nr:hypothetical protein [Candidatus Nanoarchaeia archaeon]